MRLHPVHGQLAADRYLQTWARIHRFNLKEACRLLQIDTTTGRRRMLELLDEAMEEQGPLAPELDIYMSLTENRPVFARRH